MLRENIPTGFILGVQVPSGHLQLDPTLTPAIVSNFNSITPGMDFAIGRIFKVSDEGDFEIADWWQTYLENKNFLIDGHCLLHGRTSLPRWYNLSATELESLLKKSVQSIVDRYRGFIDEWDVLGEVVSPRGGLTNTFWKKKLGPSFAAKMYYWVQEANPDARLYYSDYGMESTDKRDSVLVFCQALRGYGISLEGVALQFHHHTKGAINLSGFKKAIREVKNLGFVPKISEVTIWQDVTGLGGVAERIQGHCYGKLLQLAIDEGVSKLVLWNPFDLYSWRFSEKEPGIWDDLMQPKSAYFEMEKILQRAKKGETVSVHQTPGLIPLNSVAVDDS